MRGLTMIAVLALATIGAAPPLVPGTVAVTLVGDDDGDAAADDRDFADEVGQALGAQNYTLFGDHSRYVAEVSVAREKRGIAATRADKAPITGGVGNWGPVLAVPLGSKKTVLRDLVATTLTVRLVNRADRRPLWAGSAMTANVDGAPVAGKLARAAFATYPQTLGRPVSVP